MEIKVTMSVSDFREIKRALEEAMEWNWMDDDMPEYVAEHCRAVLKKMEE